MVIEGLYGEGDQIFVCRGVPHVREEDLDWPSVYVHLGERAMDDQAFSLKVDFTDLAESRVGFY